MCNLGVCNCNTGSRTVNLQTCANEPCTFAAIGHQDGGDFLWSGRGSGAMGPLSMHVYRSLAAAQTGEIEEFRTLLTTTGMPQRSSRSSR